MIIVIAQKQQDIKVLITLKMERESWVELNLRKKKNNEQNNRKKNLQFKICNRIILRFLSRHFKALLPEGEDLH